MAKIAAIRLKGQFGITGVFKDTMDMLGLDRRNACIIVENTPNNMGMIKKVKDYITYGEVSDEVVAKLLKKKDPISKTKTKMIFALPNPKGGYRKIKRGFNEGGDRNYRGKEINGLLERIIENI
jgi:large subunit ribosomal protein L30